MEIRRYILLWLVSCFVLSGLHAQNYRYNEELGGYLVPFVVVNGDTMPSFHLREVPVYPPIKNKRREKFYWKTVRDVKKVYPYVKIVGSEYRRMTAKLDSVPDAKQREKMMKKYERALLKQYEPTMRTFTLSQGKMMIKLIDREIDKTSYDIIKEMRGGFVAWWWQVFAKCVGADLKDDYDLSTREKDRIIERVIAQYEAGIL